MDLNNTGFIVLILSLFLFYSIFSATSRIAALDLELTKNCLLQGSSTNSNNASAACPTESTFFESIFGFGAVGALLVFSVYLIYYPRKVSSPIEETKVEKNLNQLGGEEKDLYRQILNYKGFVFQNELIEKSGLSKVKITRLLDRLEEKGLIERRRRGLSNVVVLRNS